MRKVIDYSLKCSWYCWVFIVLALLNFSPVANLLKYQIGSDLFLYLLYMSPILLLWAAMLFHTIGIGSPISIVLMVGYLIYHGLDITLDAWVFFKPIFATYNIPYIWKALMIQKINNMVYLFSGIFSLVASIGGIIYLIKNKETFKLNLKARKRKEKIHKNPYGSATLATPKDIKKFASKGKGIAIGLIPKKVIDTTNLEKSIKNLKSQAIGATLSFVVNHTVVIAPTRSGKGVGIIVPNVLLHDGGVFVLDPKAELCCITKRHRESLGKKVYVFDPKNRSNLANCNINVLDFLPKDEEEKITAIQEISKLICPQSASDNATVRHFSDSARSCIEWSILYLFFSSCPASDRTLGKVYELLTQSPDEFYDSIKESSASKVAGGALASSANIILTTAREEFSGVINSARNYLDFVKSPANKRATSSSSITAKDLCDDNVDLFLCIELPDDGTPDKLGQLITRFVFRVIREDRNKTRSKDKLMVLDELPALGYLGFVPQALTLGAGFGVKILAIFQSMEVLQTTYPNHWKTFLKSSLAIFMNCQSDDADYVADRIGKYTINVESESSGTSEQSRQGQIQQNTSQQSGTNYSSTYRELLNKSEISSFGKEIIVAFFDECPPIVCRRLNYLENKQFKGMFDDNPLHSAISHHPVILDVDKPSNTNNQIETVENISIESPLEEKVIPINNPKTPTTDDSDNATVEQFYFNSRLLIVELNNKKILMINVDDIKGFILYTAENTKPEYSKFFTITYIYENIQLSENKKFFYWNNVDIELDMRILNNISDNSRFSLIRKMDSAGSRMY